MSIGRDQDGKLHWFCEQSDVVTIEAATFLLRLFFYCNKRADSWKNTLANCLLGCSACVRSFVEVKCTSENTYFRVFDKDILRRFWSDFDKWLAKSAREALAKAGVTPRSRKTFAEAPAAVVYLMVSTLAALEDPDVVTLIETRYLPSRIPEWPIDPPAPGIIPLVVHDSRYVRRWAKIQLERSKSMTKDQFSNPYKRALDALIGSIARKDRSFSRGAPTYLLAWAPIQVLPFVSADPETVWSGMATLFRILPPECFVGSSKPLKQIDLRRLALGHLHDNAYHFADVLLCTSFLISKLGSSTWDGESDDYPKMVFDAVKNNPAFSKLLTLREITSERPWFLCWFAEYLLSLWEAPVFSDVLAKITGFMLDELQHERFQRSRPIVTAAAFRLLSSVARKCTTEKASDQYAALTLVVDVHSEFLVAVAFAREYSDSNWDSCREAALDLLRQLFTTDVDNLALTVADLANALPPVASPTTPNFQPVRVQLWKNTYLHLRANDWQGIELLLAVVSRTWHIDQLKKQAFTSSKLPTLTNTATRKTFDSTVDSVNHAMNIIRSGFLYSLSNYASYTSSTKILAFIQRKHIVQYLMALMFSPLEPLHVAAKGILGRAFDVDNRVDCFHAILDSMPDASLQGIVEVLDSFNLFAPDITEACSVSKSLVRCMTDIIEVMCNRSNGLLLNPRHVLGGLVVLEDQNDLQLATELPKLWGLLTNAIAVIVKRTPSWASYFDTDSMAELMRDALIFGRELLAERRCFESAAAGTSGQSFTDKSPKRLSKIGKRMVECLQNVLLELTRWFRLTDGELLHQSFTLLQSLLDCFMESCIPPSPAALTKLTKFIDDGRSNDARSVHTRLDSFQLSRLEEALGMFDDEEIEIISRQQFAESQMKRTDFITQTKVAKLNLRLKPDISQLQRTILSWNYCHDGPDPPTDGQKPTLRRVPERFHGYQEYREAFEPLLLYEAWSEIVKSKEETQIELYSCKIVSRELTDDWLHLDVSIDEAVKTDWYLGDTDVVLLRNDAGSKSIMGKASGFKRTPLGIQVTIRCYVVNQSSDPGLQANTLWRINKVFSLTTLHREYAALLSLPTYNLSEQVIKPRLVNAPRFKTSDVKRAMSSYQVNEPQAKAILASMKTEGFSLIQGPSGTGTTLTICGIVGAFLSCRKKAAIAIGPAGPSSDGSEKLPPKVLVCAPSNAAIDELAKRLMEGVRDSHGVRIFPKVVRVGADTTMNIGVRHISLDSLVELKLNSKENDTKPTGTEIAVLRTEIETVKRQKLRRQEQLAEFRDNASTCMILEKEIQRLNSIRMSLSNQVDQLMDKQRSDNSTLDAARRKFRHNVLNDADVICGTLSDTGHEELEQFEFEMVIIDEADQATELSSLVPLKYNSRRCILVGDPQQLSSTVLSPEATKWGYNQSLFVRTQKHNPAAAHLLAADLTVPESSEVQTAKRTMPEEDESARPPRKVRKTQRVAAQSGKTSKKAVKRPEPPASASIPKRSRRKDNTSK
ncbi:hypothetical protein BD410DRAFT_749221 [Rickenella mellea]|uniref:Helicase ATP-binding domain-containing protein n=1 Tax=Rickenella mellea TaxID=50990 RepID=A0A4Y7Q4B7_9AGAM|nr:hypothetical protein BD410DRAFT_749221 [Rickenella mellea]